MKDERLYLGHIRDAINDIKAYASVGHEAFLAERMRQDAIIRKLEIIGEAVKRLSEEIRAQRPETPWKQIAGMRDRLTHSYPILNHEHVGGAYCQALDLIAVFAHLARSQTRVLPGPLKGNAAR